MLKRGFSALIFLVFSFPVFSQSSSLGAWYIYFGNKKINQNWNWHHELQYRNYNHFGDLEQLLLRTGIGRNLKPGKHNLLLGYGFIFSENYTDSGVKAGFGEHRIYQQYQNTAMIKNLRVSNRLRFEQRMIDEQQMKLRFRHFVSVNVPLNRKDFSAGTMYLSAYNELFLNLQSKVYDRDRFYAGLGYQISKPFRVELAWMIQDFSKGSRDQVNLVCYGSF